MKIKEDDGTPYQIPNYNPLMAQQGKVWNPKEGVYINWQRFGRQVVINAFEENANLVYEEEAPPQEDFVYEEEEVKLRNEDGTSYDADIQSNTKLYDRDSADHALMNSIDQEQTQRSGAPVEYYRIMVDGRMDPVWMEQRQKVSLGQGIPMIAVYEPTTPLLSMGGFGFPIADSGEQMTFFVNKIDFLEKVGEMPRVQSIIRTCDDGMLWEITDVQVNLADSDRKIYGKHHLGLLCVKYRESITDSNPDPGPRGQSGTRDPINLPRVR